MELKCFGFKKFFKTLGARENGFANSIEKLKELIDNAFDWGGTKCIIRVNKEEKTISVYDDGVGMDVDDMRKLTKFFAEEEDPENKRVGGKGLGAKHAIFGLLGTTGIIKIESFKDGLGYRLIIDMSKIMPENVSEKNALKYYENLEAKYESSITRKGTEITLSNVNDSVMEEINTSGKEMSRTYVHKDIELNGVKLEFPELNYSLQKTFPLRLVKRKDETFVFCTMKPNGKLEYINENKLEGYILGEGEEIVGKTRLECKLAIPDQSNVDEEMLKEYFKHKTPSICPKYNNNEFCNRFSHYDVKGLIDYEIQKQIDEYNQEHNSSHKVIDVQDTNNPVVTVDYQGRKLNDISRIRLYSGDQELRKLFDMIHTSYFHTKKLDKYLNMVEANKGRFSFNGTSLDKLIQLLAKRFMDKEVKEYVLLNAKRAYDLNKASTPVPDPTAPPSVLSLLAGNDGEGEGTAEGGSEGTTEGGSEGTAEGGSEGTAEGGSEGTAEGGNIPPISEPEPESEPEPVTYVINGHSYNSGSKAFVRGTKDWVRDNLEVEGVRLEAERVCKTNRSSIMKAIMARRLDTLYTNTMWMDAPITASHDKHFDSLLFNMIVEDNLRLLYETILENDNRLNPSQTLGAGEWKKKIYDKFIEPTEN